jgi:hypothetical protein
VGCELGDVGARRERVLTRAAHHHDAHGAVGRELRDDRGDRLPHLEADRVQAGRIAEHHPGDAVRAAFDVDPEVAHATGCTRAPALLPGAALAAGAESRVECARSRGGDAMEHRFQTSRFTRGNVVFPTMMVVTDRYVTRIKPSMAAASRRASVSARSRR